VLVLVLRTALSGGSETSKRWGLIEGQAFKEDSGTSASLLSLLYHQVTTTFALPHIPAIKCCLATGLKAIGTTEPRLKPLKL
jgi:hypothetical protein